LRGRLGRVHRRCRRALGVFMTHLWYRTIATGLVSLVLLTASVVLGITGARR
jgi:hypothetical protein